MVMVTLGMVSALTQELVVVSGKCTLRNDSTSILLCPAHISNNCCCTCNCSIFATGDGAASPKHTVVPTALWERLSLPTQMLEDVAVETEMRVMELAWARTSAALNGAFAVPETSIATLKLIPRRTRAVRDCVVQEMPVKEPVFLILIAAVNLV